LEKRNLVIFSLVFVLAAAVFAASSPVYAQTPCIAQASYPTVSGPQYYYSNFAVTVPVSASCSNIGAGPLIAVGNAVDTTTSTSVGTVSTGLSSVGSGQLQFSLPPSTLGHTVQFFVSIYTNNNGQPGSILASTTQSITIGSSYYQSYPYYSSCYNGNYYNGYYASNSCYYPSYYSNYYGNGYYYQGYYIRIYSNGYGYYGYWHHHY
jgi:hypothetical protein